MRRTASPSPLLSRFPTLRRALAGATIVLLIACNSALRDAIRRGDELAAAGEWDKAALAYAEATSIDPDDDEAAEKLVQAKREQAKIRVARGNELLRAGDARGALGPFSDAVRLDPRNMEAKHGLAKAKRAVLDKAQRELEDGHYRASYDLIRAFLLVDPGDPDARRIEAGAKEKIAEAAFNRGTEAEKGGAVALALVDYGETLQFKPDHTDARSRASTLRKALREEVTYYVALKNFDGDPTADSLGSDVDAATLAAGIDAALPLRVVDTTPKPKTYKLQGMRLGGVFRNFDYDKTTTQSKQSCDYICGKELVDNPAYATAEANMRSAQSALGTAEGRLSAAKAAIGPAERARDSAKTSFETKKAEADRAEQDLSRCKSQANGQAGACAAEEQRKTRADQDEKLADDEARNTESALQKAKSELSNAESDLQSKKSDASSKKFTFEQTPPKVEVDKHCLHTYAVDTVVVAGEVECLLSGEGLYDTQNVLNRSVVGRVTRTDQTFPAQGGVCAEVAKGDPLIVPSRAEAKKLALASAIASTQKELLAAYGRYQEGYLTNGRTRSADGRSDDAVDAFVRYLLTLAAEDGGAATSEALSKAAKLRNVDDTAVRIGVFEGAKP